MAHLRDQREPAQEHLAVRRERDPVANGLEPVLRLSAFRSAHLDLAIGAEGKQLAVGAQGHVAHPVLAALKSLRLLPGVRIPKDNLLGIPIAYREEVAGRGQEPNELPATVDLTHSGS